LLHFNNTHARTHTHTQTHSVELLWMRHGSVAETSNWRLTVLPAGFEPVTPVSGGIRTRNPSKPASADLHLRRRCHRDRLQIRHRWL